MASHRTHDPNSIHAPASRRSFKGRDTRSLGPSNSSDSGSDLAGSGVIDDDLLNLDIGSNEDSEGGYLDAADAGVTLVNLDLDDTSDAEGTGERMAAGEEPNIRVGGDIGLDRIVGPEEAGLGSGLDQAEEAQLGITDEEIAELARRGR